MPLSSSEAYERLEAHLRLWDLTELTGMIVLEAARGVREHQFNFWDAQVWATARLNQIPVVFSEDFNHMATIEGVCFVNPLAQSFRIEEWV